MVVHETLENVRLPQDSRRGFIARRFAVGAMAVVVLAGATGWLGVRAETKHSAGFGYRMTLVYPRIARPGLDVPWNLRLTHPGGFKGQITVAISANYFDIFEYQDFHPEASGETADAKFVYLSFTAPKGNVFTLSFDTYVQPASQIGRDAETKVIVGGVTVASTHYSTWLVP